MPTGYTAAVCDGKVTDFNTFAMRCARNFGALVLMREEAFDAPIPEFQPSAYNIEGLKKAQAELAAVMAMSPAECDQAAEEDYRKALSDRQRYEGECKVIRDRLQAMRAKVADWEPPTSEHVGLKEFMIQQLDETVSFDGTPYHSDSPKRMSAKEWMAKQVNELTRTLAYHTEENRKEIERTNGRNTWVAQLRASLKS
jgi:hypothetical protein